MVGCASTTLAAYRCCGPVAGDRAGGVLVDCGPAYEAIPLSFPAAPAVVGVRRHASKPMFTLHIVVFAAVETRFI